MKQKNIENENKFHSIIYRKLLIGHRNEPAGFGLFVLNPIDSLLFRASYCFRRIVAWRVGIQVVRWLHYVHTRTHTRTRALTHTKEFEEFFGKYLHELDIGGNFENQRDFLVIVSSTEKDQNSLRTSGWSKNVPIGATAVT